MGSGDLLLIGLDVVALAAALWITLVSFRAYRAGRSHTYFAAFVGFSFLTLGVASEALLFRVSGLGITTVHTFETLLFLVGFGFLYLSLN